MNLELAGKTVVITGGSAGIGLACAEAFLGEGANVAIVGRNRERADEARRRLLDKGHVLAIAADMVAEPEAERAANEVEAELGLIDVWVNCAGAARRVEPEALDEAAWREGFESKFLSYMNATTVILRRFRARYLAWKEQNPQAGAKAPAIGAIVNVIGKGGKSPSDTHLPGGAANAGLMLATAGLAQAYAHMGVRINAINPASIMTQRLERRFELEAQRKNRSKQELMASGAADMPLGRYAEPAEVADAVLFLASRRASYLAGTSLMIDGGQRPIV